MAEASAGTVGFREKFIKVNDGFIELARLESERKSLSHADLKAGIISLKGQLDGVRDGLIDNAQQNYEKLLLMVGICSAKPKRKAPRTKRKERNGK